MLFVRNLLLSLLLVTQVLGSPWFQNDPGSAYEEEVYLSLRYQGILDEILVAYYDGTTFYLPLIELFDIFAVNYEANPSEFSVKGFFLDEDNRYSLDFLDYSASVGENNFQLDANDFLLKEIDYFVSPKLLNEVFDLGVEVDISRLTVRLAAPQELPIAKRYSQRKREQLRQRYTQYIDESEYKLISARQPKLADGAFFDYSFYSAVSEQNTSANVNIGVGGELLAGDVQGSLISKSNQEGGEVSTKNLRWRYVDTSQPWYTSVTLGEQSSSGLINQSYRGIRITNEPLIPKRSYDTYVIDGVTDPDAEVELYENDRLVDVIKADDAGYYRFMIPLNYGQSDFKIKIYAKQGQVIELDRRVDVPFNFLPVNEVRYAFSTGRVTLSDSPWKDQPEILSSRVAMGLKNWLTGGLGLEYISNGNKDRPVFYGQLSSRLPNDMLVGVDAVLSNYYRFSLRNSTPAGASFNGDYTYYLSQGLYNVGGYLQRFSSNFFIPFTFKNKSFTARSSVNYTQRQESDELSISANMIQYAKGVRFQYGLKENHRFASNAHTASSSFNMGAVYVIPRRPNTNPWLQSTYLRSEISYNRILGKFHYYNAHYIKQINPRLQAQSLVSIDLIGDSKFFEIGIVWDVDKLRTATSLRSAGSTPTIIESVRGSVGWDRNYNNMVWDNRQQVGRSGLTVRMFVDENNSGKYEDGEEVLKGNALTLMQNSARPITNNGVTRMTQLQPYRRYNFQINESRIDNPMLSPPEKKFSIVTDPNRYKLIEIPFYTMGIIEGSVDRKVSDQLLPVAGLKIHIRGLERDFEQTVRTFADGSFYSMDIPPGNYEAWVDDSQLEFLSMISVPAIQTFRVEANADGEYIEGLDFLLE